MTVIKDIKMPTGYEIENSFVSQTYKSVYVQMSDISMLENATTKYIQKYYFTLTDVYFNGTMFNTT